MSTETPGAAIPRVLVVDDEAGIREDLKDLLTRHGAKVEAAHDLEDAVRRNEHQPFDLIFVDPPLPGEDGRSCLDSLRAPDPAPEVIFLAGLGGAAGAEEVTRQGAYDVIEKPFDPARVLALTDRCLETRRLKSQVELLRRRVRELTSTEIVGQSKAIKELLLRIGQVAKAPDTTILIEGRHGTGKELVARRLHERSSRADGLFVSINCAALTESLLEAELFGYEAGAFTGAMDQGKDGLFAAAEGGTLLLDEVGAMPLNLQAKLLRVLQEKSFRRVGGVKDRPARARVIASTHRDLAEEVARGNFREDLYFRLHVITLRVPQLVERADDIPLLAHYFLDHFSRQMGKALTGFSEEAMETLCEHTWPGNVRELKNSIEHAAILCSGGLVDEHHLPRWDGGVPGGGDRIPRETVELPAGDRSLRSVEKELVQLVLEETSWNISKAASMLGINRTTLYNKIKLHNLGARPSRARIPF